ncbi:MAG: hypothetical protein RBS25_06015 [Bacilli bacterium]|jgi:hypothetical protein|nr:hypothetical protein [Bacilli bacterium]
MAKRESIVDVNNEVVNIAKGESIVKTYEGFETLDPAGHGSFTITTKRLLFYASYKDKEAKSTAVWEWPLENIGGIMSESGKRKNKIQVIISYLFLLVSVGFLVLAILDLTQMQTGLFPYMTSFIVAGSAFFLFILLFCLGKRKMFFLEIYSRIPMNPIISLKSSFFKSPNHGKIQIVPNSNTLQMIKELGKTIIEAQTLAEYLHK